MRFVPMDCAMSSFSTHVFPPAGRRHCYSPRCIQVNFVAQHRIEMPSTFEGTVSPVALAVFVT